MDRQTDFTVKIGIKIGWGKLIKIGLGVGKLIKVDVVQTAEFLMAICSWGTSDIGLRLPQRLP